MSYTFSDTCDFGTGAALTALVAELLDPSGTVVASTAFVSFVDIGGGSGRQFEFSLTAPDGFTSGAERVRDLNGVERSLVDSINIIFPGASVIVPSPPIPQIVMAGDTVVIAFTTISLPSGTATDATGTLTASLQRNGVVDSAVHPVVTHVGTGLYSVSVVIPITYVSTDTVALVINATVAGVVGVNVVFQGVLQPVPTIAPPGTAELWGYEYSNGNPVVGRSVTLELLDPPQTTSSVILEVQTVTTLSLSSPAGRWGVYLVIGKTYRLSIPEAGIDKTFTMPAVSTDARTLL